MYEDKVAFVSVLRKDASDNDKESYVTHSGFKGPGGIDTAAISINIQPAGAKFTALAGGVIGKMYKGFTTASGVKDGMVLTMSGSGKRFMVRGSEFYDFVLETNELVLSEANA